MFVGCVEIHTLTLQDKKIRTHKTKYKLMSGKRHKNKKIVSAHCFMVWDELMSKRKEQ